jgi:hypothetical protein
LLEGALEEEDEEDFLEQAVTPRPRAKVTIKKGYKDFFIHPIIMEKRSVAKIAAS